MNSIDARADRLARSLFDDGVLPLSEKRRATDRPEYFPRSGEAGLVSYFEPPSHRVMEPSDFDFPGGGVADGLIDALALHWMSQGEDDLAAMAPQLKEIAEALREEAVEDDGSVDILCYTMI